MQHMAIRKLIEDYDKAFLDLAKGLNDKVSFYSEIQGDGFKSHPYYHTFKQRLTAIFKDQYKTNDSVSVYLSEVLPTYILTSKIFDRLKNVFKSSNSAVNIEVKNKLDQDVKTEINFVFDYFKNEGWNIFKSKFNSFRVVDKDKDGNPYLINVEPQYVYYLKEESKKKLKEIIFSFDEKIYYYYTDIFYSVYEKTEQGDYRLKQIETKQNKLVNAYYEHEIGRCPANFFYNDFLNSNTLLRKNALSIFVEALFHVVFKSVEQFSEETKLVNVTKSIPSDVNCGYRENNNIICKGGRLYYDDVDTEQGGRPVLLDDDYNTQKLCPSCGNFVGGSGGIISLDYANAPDNISLGDDLIKYYAPPLETIEYNKLTLNELMRYIESSAVGVIETETREARNEVDVRSGFESAEKILTDFGHLIAEAEQDTIDIVLRILYKNSYISNSVFMGNSFYLLNKSQLQEIAKNSTNPIEYSEATQKIIEYDYQNNTDKLKLIKTIYEHLPYAGTNDERFYELIDLGKVSDFDIELRTNINYYVQRFKRDLKNSKDLLAHYKNNTEYDFISKTISEYVNENLKTQNIKENETEKQGV